MTIEQFMKLHAYEDVQYIDVWIDNGTEMLYKGYYEDAPHSIRQMEVVMFEPYFKPHNFETVISFDV